MKWYEIKNQTKDKAEISLYGEIGIGENSAIAFKKTLQSLNGVKELHIRFNTVGGAVSDGFAICALLDDFKAKKIGHVDSAAHSIGSIILTRMDEIKIASNAFILIHNPRLSISSGVSDELDKASKYLKDIKSEMIVSYKRKIKNKSDEEISKLMDDETILTAREAIDMGLADELYKPVQAAASFNLSIFNNKIPEKIQNIINKENQMDWEAKTKELEGQVTALKTERDTLASAPKAADFMAFAKQHGLEFAEKYFGKSDSEIAVAKAELLKAEAEAKLKEAEAKAKELEAKLKAVAGGESKIPATNSESSANNKKATGEQIKVWKAQGLSDKQIDDIVKELNEVK